MPTFYLKHFQVFYSNEKAMHATSHTEIKYGKGITLDQISRCEKSVKLSHRLMFS